jgi:hypothetical protein
MSLQAILLSPRALHQEGAVNNAIRPRNPGPRQRGSGGWAELRLCLASRAMCFSPRLCRSCRRFSAHSVHFVDLTALGSKGKAF